MKDKLPKMPGKPQVETKEHEVDPGKDRDVIVKVGKFRLYFQNYYTIISLTNDILTGILYLAGSILSAFTDFERVPMYLYIFASFFLLMRPILKIMNNVFLYDEQEYQEQVLGEVSEDGESSKKDKPTKEVEFNTEDDSDDNSEESNRDYNEGYYGSNEKNE